MDRSFAVLGVVTMALACSAATEPLPAPVASAAGKPQASAAALPEPCKASAPAIERANALAQLGLNEAAVKALDAAGACGASDPLVMARRRAYLAELGRCDPAAGLDTALAATCASYASRSAKELARAALQEPAGSAASRLAFGRVLVALERETKAKARVLSDWFPRGTFFFSTSGHAVASIDKHVIRPEPDFVELGWRLEDPPFESLDDVTLDGQQLLAINGKDLELHANDAAFSPIKVFPNMLIGDVVMLLPDGSRIVSGTHFGGQLMHGDAGFQLFEASSGKLLATVTEVFDSSGYGLSNVQTSSNSKLVIAAFINRGVALTDAVTGRAISVPAHTKNPMLSDDGRFVIACSGDDDSRMKYFTFDSSTLRLAKGNGLPCVSPLFVEGHRFIPVQGPKVGGEETFEFLNVETGKRVKEQPSSDDLSDPSPKPLPSALASAAELWTATPASGSVKLLPDGRLLIAGKRLDATTAVFEACTKATCADGKPLSASAESNRVSVAHPTLGPIQIRFAGEKGVAIARGLGAAAKEKTGLDAEVVSTDSAARELAVCQIGQRFFDWRVCEGRFSVRALEPLSAHE